MKNSGFFNISLDEASLLNFRLVTALTVLIDIVFFKLPYLDDFFLQNSVITTDIIYMLKGGDGCPLLLLFDYEGFPYIVFGVMTICAVLFATGVKPKITGALLVILHIAMQERVFLLLNGGDQVLRLLLLFAYLSLYFGKSGYFQFALLLQVALMYFLNGVYKNGSTWYEGSAAAYATMSAFHKAPLSSWIYESRALTAVSTYSILLFEMLLPLFIFVRGIPKGRTIAACSILAFHLLLLPFLNVGNFFLVGFPLVMLLLPPNLYRGKVLFKTKSTIHASGRVAKYAGVFLIIFVALNGLFNETKFMKSLCKSTCNCAGFSQRWKMFAPDPAPNNGYMLVTGTTAEGRKINLYNNQSIITHDFAAYPVGYHFLPYYYFHLNITLPLFMMQQPEVSTAIFQNWAQFIKREWEEENNQELLKVSFYKVQVEILKRNKYSTPKLYLLNEAAF